MNRRTFFILCAALCLRAGSAPAAAPSLPAEIVGTWEVSDPRINKVITTITIGADGAYSGGSWGRDWGGPNGLGASRVRYDNPKLEFIYVKAGGRVDVMLSGVLLSEGRDADHFNFRVAGGYYNHQVDGKPFTFFFTRIAN